MPIPGFGSVLKVTIVSTPTAIGDVVSIDGPSMSADMIDITAMDDATKFRSFMPGLIDGGELSFEIQMNPTNATQQYIQDSLAQGGIASTGAVEVFSLEWNDGSSTSWDFSGYFKSIGPAAPLDGIVTQTVTVQVSGAVTLP